jgi:hypothetical protein
VLLRPRAIAWVQDLDRPGDIDTREIARLMGIGSVLGIAPWNDAPERTQAEVVAKLREAAALAQEQGL